MQEKQFVIECCSVQIEVCYWDYWHHSASLVILNSRPHKKVFSMLLTASHDFPNLKTKPTKWHVCPAKSSLSAWRKLGSLATHWAHSEHSDQIGQMLGAQSFCWFCHETALIISVCFAIRALTKLIVGRKLADIFGNFGGYWREITNDDQARWVGISFSSDQI